MLIPPSFIFPPNIQAGLVSGAYEIMRSKVTGQLLSIAIDAGSKKIVGHAVGAAINCSPLGPFAPIAQIFLGGAQMAQTHRGFQKNYQLMDAGFQETYGRLDVIKLGMQFIQNLGVAQIATNVGMGGAQMAQNHLGFQETYRVVDAGFEITNDKLDLIQTAIQALKINPLTAPLQMATTVVTGGAQMYQTNQGFQRSYREIEAVEQALLSSVATLQATTAVIGVGTAAGVVLSGVNLWQTLKLREDVKQLRLEVREGFLDLKQALKDQGAEIIQHIDEVAHDIKFEQHRLVLIRAYGLFTQALQRFQLAMKIQDAQRRNAEIDAARGMLYQALADYSNPGLLEEVCAAGRLRRLECAWAIDQAIITTYQVQNELSAVSVRLSHLQEKICQDSLNIIKLSNSEPELDFLFPEITRIHTHDLAVLNSWQNHVDWMQTLSPDEQQELANLQTTPTETAENNQSSDIFSEPLEQLIYEDLKQKSHYPALRDQLNFLVKPTLRQNYETFISKQAKNTGLTALATSNWQEVPDLTVANLYYYFQAK